MSSHRAKRNYKAPTNHNVNARIKGKIQQGFTILEVIIVLVIAAIIMLAVFLVVPQLQRSSRNNKAKAIARQVTSAAITFRTQQGAYPTCTAPGTTCAAITNITGPLKSPTGANYSYVTAIPTTNTQIMIINTGACGASPSATPNFTTGTKFIVVIFQENAGSSSLLCSETP